MKILLTKFGDEQIITIPKTETFTQFIAAIRQQVPDRRWQIAESWEVA